MNKTDTLKFFEQEFNQNIFTNKYNNGVLNHSNENYYNIPSKYTNASTIADSSSMGSITPKEDLTAKVGSAVLGKHYVISRTS